MSMIIGGHLTLSLVHDDPREWFSIRFGETIFT